MGLDYTVPLYDDDDYRYVAVSFWASFVKSSGTEVENPAGIVYRPWFWVI